MINPKMVPSILLDFPRTRIRINKRVLRSLNNPDYVRLLINPDTRTFAIESCDDTEPRKHRIPSHVKNSRQCFEIRSMSFLEQLAIHAQWDTRSAYKVCASAQAGKQLLLFRFDDAFLSVQGRPVLENNEMSEKLHDTQINP